MNDLINCIFECFGGVLVWLNVAKLLKDKKVSGLYWPVQAFFAGWGLWNLYYYPSLDQWASFVGGLVLAIGNLVWVILAYRYSKIGLKNKKI